MGRGKLSYFGKGEEEAKNPYLNKTEGGDSKAGGISPCRQDLKKTASLLLKGRKENICKKRSC